MKTFTRESETTYQAPNRRAYQITVPGTEFRLDVVFPGRQPRPLTPDDLAAILEFAAGRIRSMNGAEERLFGRDPVQITLVAEIIP